MGKGKKEENTMVTKSIKVEISGGLAGKNVASLVQVASKHESSIYIECENKRVNAKSIMGMMSLGIAMGELVDVIANGADEQVAIEAMEKYISSK